VNRRLTTALALVAASALALMAAPYARASGPTLPSSDPFYSYSRLLAGIAPGTVLRTRTISLAENGTSTAMTGTQVLYRTTSELGLPTVTVATVIAPAPQIGPTRIVSYQTAYDALGSQCDPSYTLQGGTSGDGTASQEEQVILGYVKAGDTVVVSDYEGENLDWGAGQESGYGTLDGIRAAEHLLSLPTASTPVGMIGYSGGSIATEFASELAPSYAGNLDIVGVAEGGIPVDFFHNLAYINGSPSWSGVIPAEFVALSRAFGISFANYLSPYGAKIFSQVKYECINSFFGSYPGLTYQKLFKPQYQNIFKIAPIVSVTDHLIMSDSGTPKGPLFIGVGNADGTGDGIMVAADDEALAHTYCQRGVPVQFSQYSGDDHTQAAVPFEVAAASFLAQRLAGIPVSNGCASIGTGNSLALVAIPAGTPQLRFAYLGKRKQLRGVVVGLWTSTGTLGNLVLSLRRGGKPVATVRVSRLTTTKRVFVLRSHGHIPRPGHYVLELSKGAAILLGRHLTIH